MVEPLPGVLIAMDRTIDCPKESCRLALAVCHVRQGRGYWKCQHCPLRVRGLRVQAVRLEPPVVAA